MNPTNAHRPWPLWVALRNPIAGPRQTAALSADGRYLSQFRPAFGNSSLSSSPAAGSAWPSTIHELPALNGRRGARPDPRPNPAKSGQKRPKVAKASCRPQSGSPPSTLVFAGASRIDHFRTVLSAFGRANPGSESSKTVEMGLSKPVRFGYGLVLFGRGRSRQFRPPALDRCVGLRKRDPCGAPISQPSTRNSQLLVPSMPVIDPPTITPCAGSKLN